MSYLVTGKKSIQYRLLEHSKVVCKRERRDVSWMCDDVEDCLHGVTVQTGG